MFSLRYGTVPVVRKTGGLADSIQMFNLETKEGNGFLFETYDAGGILWALNEAVSVYEDKDAWNKLVENCMNTKLSWADSAEKYIELYEEVLSK
jgi:starch synthase